MYYSLNYFNENPVDNTFSHSLFNTVLEKSLTMIPHSFSTQARDQYQKLKIMHSNMVTLYLNMLEFFAIDSKKTSVEELFTDLSNFRAMFMVSRDSDSAHNHSLYII